MSDTRVRDALTAFGLSEKEVDAYLSVLRRGEATTRAVSEAADVSQSYVYEIATELAERGLVTVDESATPTSLRARPPAEVVDVLAERVEAFEDAAESLYHEPPRRDPSFEVVRSPRTVRRRVGEYLAETEEEAFLILPAGAFEQVADALADAVDRGVWIYCMLAAPNVGSAYAEIGDPGRYAHVIRTWDSRPPLFVLSDDEAGILAARGMVQGASGERYAVAFRQPEVASGFYGNYVSNVWPMGEQRYVVEPPALPATFGMFRSWAVAATLHANAGRDLVADVEARDNAADDCVTLEGVRVREVRQHLVEPWNSAFPTEASLVVEVDDGLATVGGQTSGLENYYEGYAASQVTLREA